MKKTASVLASLLLALGFLLAPVSVSAHQSCTDTKVRLFEDFNRGGDFRDFCGNINDLNAFTHTQAGNCDNAWIGDNSWDDCASSWQVIANPHLYCIQIWANPLDFGIFKVPLLEGGFRATGYWSNFDNALGVNENNSATSIEWQSTSTCAVNP